MSAAIVRDSMWVTDSNAIAVHVDRARVLAGHGITSVAAVSSDTTVAVVASSVIGDSTATLVVRGRGPGRAVITMTVLLTDSTSGTATSTVVVRPGYPLALWPDTNVLVVGAARSLVARTVQSPMTFGVVAGAHWVSDAPNIAAVDSAGHVTAVSPGQATITATLPMGSVGGQQATATVRVQAYPAPLAFTSLVTATQDWPGIYPVLLTFTCGVTREGRAYCWGNGAAGDLGTDEPVDRCEAIVPYSGPHISGTRRQVFRCSATPVEVAGNLRFTQLSAYAAHVCGVTTGGEVYCWGDNSTGQLGTGDVTPQSTPRRVDASVRFRAVSVGLSSTCALTTDGAPYCWGRNTAALGGLGAKVAGLLGTDSRDDVVSRPQPVAGASTLTSITVGDTHACGISAGGVAWCWGDNLVGQLGDGRPYPGTCATLTDTACVVVSLRPRQVAGSATYRVIVAGHNSTCALNGTGEWCWGFIGIGVPEATGGVFASGLKSRVPTQISAAPPFASLVSPPWGDPQSPTQACGLGMDGVVTCVRGADTLVPAVRLGLRFTTVASAGWPPFGASACGIAGDSYAYCWSAATFGTRGDGQLSSVTDLTGVPGRVVGQ